MKRRQFLKGVGAAALVTPLLSHSATQLPSDEVPRSGIYDALIVVPSGLEATEIWTAMGMPANVKIIGPGAALTFTASTNIIIDHDANEKHWLGERYEDWLNEVVRTRRVPGGREVSVRWREAEFNYRTQCGLSAAFVDLEGEQYLRMAQHWFKPLKEMTYGDRIEAKAGLLTWYMGQVT